MVLHLSCCYPWRSQKSNRKQPDVQLGPMDGLTDLGSDEGVRDWDSPPSPRANPVTTTSTLQAAQASTSSEAQGPITRLPSDLRPGPRDSRSRPTDPLLVEDPHNPSHLPGYPDHDPDSVGNQSGTQSCFVDIVFQDSPPSPHTNPITTTLTLQAAQGSTSAAPQGPITRLPSEPRPGPVNPRPRPTDLLQIEDPDDLWDSPGDPDHDLDNSWSPVVAEASVTLDLEHRPHEPRPRTHNPRPRLLHDNRPRLMDNPRARLHRARLHREARARQLSGLRVRLPRDPWPGEPRPMLLGDPRPRVLEDPQYGPPLLDDVGGSQAAEEGMPQFDFASDLLHKVFSFLVDSDLCRAAMVCKQWRAVSAHEEFWMALNFENKKVTPEQVVRLCQTYPRAASLNLRGVECADEVFLQTAARSLGNLSDLILGNGCLSDMFFNELQDTCRVLESLAITNASLGVLGNEEVNLAHDTVRTVQLWGCRVSRLAFRCPILHILSLHKTSLTNLLLACPLLTSLDISDCRRLADSAVRAAVTSCPLLTSLNVSSCVCLTNETLREIAGACNALAVLDASNCPNLTLEGLHLPSMADLRLSACEGITSNSMSALNNSVLLETLVLDHCWLLAATNLDLPCLRTLSMQYCKKLTEVILRTPSLTDLNLYSCPSLTKLEVSSTSIQSLGLTKQPCLTTVALACPYLQTLDLSDCDALQNDVCKVLGEVGVCNQLNYLTLDGCEGLTEVRLSSASLQSLSLMGCRNLSLLDLKCPDLSTLLLDGCDHLSSAKLSPVGLSELNLGICPYLADLDLAAASLMSLDLRGCGALTSANLVCPRLTSLDASYCSQLEDSCLSATAFSCTALRSLVLAACPAVGSRGLEALARLPALTALDLSYTELVDLAPLFTACPTLKILHLSACKWLADNSLAPLHNAKALLNLVELDVSYCNLSDSALGDLLAYCPHLTHVSFNGCAKLSDAVWQRLAEPLEVPGKGGGESVLMDIDNGLESKRVHRPGKEPVQDVRPAPADSALPKRQLSSLSCVGCLGLRTVCILPVTAVPGLTSLNLSLSSNIQRLILNCQNLTVLNVTNCGGLETMDLECPKLTTLYLQAVNKFDIADMIHAASRCMSLETLDIRNCDWVSNEVQRQLRATCPGLRRLYSSIAG